MSSLFVKYSLFAFPIASCGLGVWQIKRLEWKKGIVADLEKQLTAEPIDLLSIESFKDFDEYRRVKTRGRYDPDPSHQLYLLPRPLITNDEAILRGKSAHQTNTGVNVITPFYVEGTNLRVLVNRGWLALKGKDNYKENSDVGLNKGETIELVGILRKSDNRPRYGARNNMTTNEWQFRDVEAMSRALNCAPIFIDAEQDRNRTSGPIGGQTQLNIRNEHLNYAITWFSLAVLSYLMWYTKYGKRGILFTNRR